MFYMKQNDVTFIPVIDILFFTKVKQKTHSRIMKSKMGYEIYFQLSGEEFISIEKRYNI